METQECPPVAFVLLAEFDIDKGSILRHQYPRPTGLGESLLAELMLPEGAHLRDSDFTLFTLPYSKLNGIEAPKELQDDKYDPETGVLFCQNVVRTKMDVTVKRGANVKALAVCTPYRFFDAMKPILMLALDRYYAEPGEGVLESVYKCFNDITQSIVDIPRLHGVDMRVRRAIRLRLLQEVGSRDTVTHSLQLSWNGAQIPFRVPIAMEVNEVAGSSVSTLVEKFQEDTMTIYNALVTEKRVIFIGHNQPAHDVCNLVLSACMLVNPMRGSLHRAFPYANLTQMDFLSKKGFIAGVTNPIFSQKEQWWDIMCDIQSGVVKLSSHYEKEMSVERDPTLHKLSEADGAFIAKVISGKRMKYGEEWVRCMFRDYTQHVLDMASDEEVYKDDEAMVSEKEAQSHRIRVLRSTEQFQRYAQDRAQLEKDSVFGDMHHTIRKHVRTLQVKQNISDQHAVTIFKDILDNVNSSAELKEFLALFPESLGGLYPIAVCLFHKALVVRGATVELLKRLDNLKEGSSCVSSLNYHLLLTYHRASREFLEKQKTTDGSRSFQEVLNMAVLPSTEHSEKAEDDEDSDSPRPESPFRLPPRVPDGLLSDSSDDSDFDLAEMVLPPEPIEHK